MGFIVWRRFVNDKFARASNYNRIVGFVSYGANDWPRGEF